MFIRPDVYQRHPAFYSQGKSEKNDTSLCRAEVYGLLSAVTGVTAFNDSARQPWP